MAKIAGLLLPWFELHGRKNLPWQQPDGYRVWLSEVMLQQTQVATVIPYFERFVESFPDVVSLADAPLERVLQHWAGLGYYARARNLHRAAIEVRDRHQGRFPDDFEALIELPGIGRSTAGAIQSLAFGKKATILDGNVKRVLARVYRVEGWPGQSKPLQRLWQLAEQQTPATRCAEYNQAMMDLGATLCSRRKPRCGSCPLKEMCQSYKADCVLDYPARKPKKARPLKQVWMMLHRAEDQLLLEQRATTGIWGGLYSLPELSGLDLLPGWQAQNLGCESRRIETREDRLLHRFSHFDLQISTVHIWHEPRAIVKSVAESERFLWVDQAEIEELGMPTPVRKILRDDLGG